MTQPPAPGLADAATPVMRALPLATTPRRASERPAARLLRALPLACVVLALATLLLPVALTHMPPLLDYPNHLARMWLLAGGADHGPLSAMYAVDWSGASTNIGVDLIAATLGRVIGGWAVGTLLLGAAVLLPALGAVLLNRAVFGGWHWWQVGFAVLAWNGTLMAGFLNFQIGLGLAFLAAAMDPAVARRTGPLGLAVVRVAAGAALLVFHAFAAGLYGVLLASLAFGAGAMESGGADAFWRRAWRAAVATGPAIGIPLACFLLFAPTLPGGHAPPGIYDAWSGYTLADKITTVLSSIATYDYRLDLLAVLLLWAAARLVSVRPLLRCHAGLLAGASGLMALAVLCPPTLGGTAFVDWRFPIMAVLMAAAALRPGFRSARVSQVAAAALLALVLARTGWITEVWRGRQDDVLALEEVLAFVPAGAAVLPVEHTPADEDVLPLGRRLASGVHTYWHLPSLAVPLRGAFIPTLFTAPGKQPLRVRPPWSGISVLEGGPAPVRFLRAYAPSPLVSYLIGYMENWRERFDYVLVLNADHPDTDDEASLPGLELLTDRGFARLYRIVRP